MLTSIAVAAEWPDSAFSLLSWWPRSGPIQHSHFYRGGRGVAQFSGLNCIVVAPMNRTMQESTSHRSSSVYVADDDDEDGDDGGDYVFLCGGSVCVSVDSRQLLNRMNTDLKR